MNRFLKAAYPSNPEPPIDEPESVWDRYYNQFEQWLNDNYENGHVFGLPWDEACESEDLLGVFIEEYHRV